MHRKGKKGTRKLSPGLKSWNDKVMKAFREGRAREGKSYMLKDAMKDAKRSS